MANKNAFAVVLPGRDQDPNGFYKSQLVNLLTSGKYPKLTIAGFDQPDVRRGIEYAGPGNLMTFGSATNHDVNWVERPTYACEKGIAPVYVDLHTEWNQVVASLDKYYNEKYPRTIALTISDGRKVKINDGFIQIGYDVYPYATFKAVDTLTISDIRAIAALLV